MPYEELSDLQICRWALDGEVGIYDAAKALFANHSYEDPWDAAIPEVEALYNLVNEIELLVPLGASRQHWNAEALAEKDRLRETIETKHRAAALSAFGAIIDDYKRAGRPRDYYAWPRSSPQSRQ